LYAMKDIFPGMEISKRADYYFFALLYRILRR